MSEKLGRLFDLYSSDLEQYAPELAGFFFCPLCLQSIPRVADLRPVVAEEHTLPEKLGGRTTTLTCKKCNNDQGSSLESHMIQRVKVEAGTLPLGIRMSVGEGEQGGELYLPRSDSDPFEIQVVDKQSDPRRLEEVERGLRDNEAIHLRGSFGYNEPRSVVALLRSAYLLMFRYFGYRYIFDPSAKPILWQIQNPLESGAALGGIMWRSPSWQISNRVCIVTNPKKLRCFSVILRLDAETDHHAGVLLPPPGEDGSEFFAMVGSKPLGILQMRSLEKERDGFLPFLETWNYHFGDEAPLT